jgi:hypothetical protein
MKNQRRPPIPRIDRLDRQLSATPGSYDTATSRDDVLDALSEDVRKADAMITSAEKLFAERRSKDGIGGWDDDTNDDYLPRRENHIAHLLESAKLAARAAIRRIEELEKCKA